MQHQQDCGNPSLSERVASLKRLKSDENWLLSIFRNEIIDLVKFGQKDISLDRLGDMVYRVNSAFSRDFSRFAATLRNCDPSGDCTVALHYAGVESLQTLHASHLGALRTLFAKFAESPFCHSLLSLEYTSMRDFRSPDSFIWENMELLAAPDLIFSSPDGCVKIVSFNAYSPECGGEWDFRNGIYALYAWQKMKTPPERVNTFSVFFRADSELALLPLPYRMPPGESLEKIAGTAKAMQDFENSTVEACIPKPSLCQACISCAFRTLCW